VEKEGDGWVVLGSQRSERFFGRGWDRGPGVSVTSLTDYPFSKKQNQYKNETTISFSLPTK